MNSICGILLQAYAITTRNATRGVRILSNVRHSPALPRRRATAYAFSTTSELGPSVNTSRQNKERSSPTGNSNMAHSASVLDKPLIRPDYSHGPRFHITGRDALSSGDAPHLRKRDRAKQTESAPRPLSSVQFPA